MNILMVTIGYPPRQVGGTEVYVFGLVEALKPQGHECSIVYIEPFTQEGGPEIRVDVDDYLGTRVYVIRVNSIFHKLEFLVFDPVLRGKLLDHFRKLVADLQPDVVHVHPLQLGFESYLIEMLNRGGHHAILTYHSTNTSCARGDLIFMGEQVCDGRLIHRRCTECLYQWKSVPRPLASTLSRIPLRFYRKAFEHLKPYPAARRLRSFTSIPLIVEERFKAWSRATSNANAIVAVCEWVQKTIIKNNVPDEKVILSRHGLRLAPEPSLRLPPHIPRYGYLGRVSPEKGIQVLIAALEQIPPATGYEFEFCSSTFDKAGRSREEEKLVKAIFDLQNRDNRIRVLQNVGDDDLASVLARWDALIVPSLWLESGPQVIYESFAVQTPVIGSRRGGIAELVREGETGFLFAPGDADALAALLIGFAKDPTRLRALRDHIPPVRTTEHVAADMLRIYNRLMETAAADQAL